MKFEVDSKDLGYLVETFNEHSQDKAAVITLVSNGETHDSCTLLLLKESYKKYGSAKLIIEYKF